MQIFSGFVITGHMRGDLTESGRQGRRLQVTVHTPLSREVFWHEYAKIPRHTSQNSIATGNLE